MIPTKAYFAALQVSDDATLKFLKAQEAYRARKISDAEYCAAFAEHKAALAAFDAAYAAEVA